jgi:hypothetical protein
MSRLITTYPAVIMIKEEIEGEPIYDVELG